MFKIVIVIYYYIKTSGLKKIKTSGHQFFNKCVLNFCSSTFFPFFFRSLSTDFHWACKVHRVDAQFHPFCFLLGAPSNLLIPQFHPSSKLPLFHHLSLVNVLPATRTLALALPSHSFLSIFLFIVAMISQG